MSRLSPALPDSLGEQLRCAVAVTPALIADVIGAFSQHLPYLSQEVRSKRIGQLIRLGAWTDVALALIELELPQWKVRRLAYDDGEWFCTLSCERDLPDWLGNSVEAHHADLALAILSAFVEVQRDRAEASRPSVPGAGRSDSALYEPLCCDSFS